MNYNILILLSIYNLIIKFTSICTFTHIQVGMGNKLYAMNLLIQSKSTIKISYDNSIDRTAVLAYFEDKIMWDPAYDL